MDTEVAELLGIHRFLLQEMSAGNAVLFCGAGVSQGRYPTWDRLLRELAAEAGLPATEIDPLDLPQWYVEARGRAALEQHLVRTFDAPAEPTPLQCILARFPWDVVFTTNYDRLLERALAAQGREVDVVVEDTQVGRVAERSRTTLVKMHGCVSRPHSLVVTREGQLLAVDGKMLLDDNALFRHFDLAEMRDADEETPEEQEARRHGLSYVKLDGEIGCMVNGAGLAMATMDITKLHGGEPANFLDIGGGAQADKVASALRIILSDPNVKAVLLNIFGGITRCDEVARGILAALEEVETDVPLVARLAGTNEEEGRRILSEAKMITAAALEEAAQKAVAAATAYG